MIAPQRWYEPELPQRRGRHLLLPVLPLRDALPVPRGVAAAWS